MTEPNFFIVGAPKCGTTTIADWLRQHPQVFLPKQKEPHHFNKDHNFNVYESYDQYLDLFSDATDAKAVGEASVWYLYSSVAVEEIEKHYNNAKYIVCLRDPVDMAYSLYWEQVYATNETVENFEKAWNLSPRRRIGDMVPSSCREPKHLDYMFACRLGFQVKELKKKVPKNRIKFIFLEDVKNEPENVYEDLLSFLEIQSFDLGRYSASNTFKKVRWPRLKRLIRLLGSLRRKLPLKTRFGILNYINSINRKESERPVMDKRVEAEVRRYFHEDIKLLAKLTGRNLDAWLAGA